MAATNLVPGTRFGRLTIIGPAEPRKTPSGKTLYYVNVICDCGTTKDVFKGSLVHRRTVSCGCLQKEVVAAIIGRVRYKHGATSGRLLTPEFRSWRSMIKRCEYRSSASYPRYGGCGISICTRWRHGEDGKTGFGCFLADMGRKPSPTHTIDRIDNDGNYEPTNCRWATKAEQSRNRRPRRSRKTN